MPQPQSSRWCFTLNNYTSDETQLVIQLGEHELVKYLIFGREQGQSGTPHLQGFIIFTRSVRRTRVSGLIPRAHLEPARGTSVQASTYCKKDNDYEEFGELPQGNKSNALVDTLVSWGDAFIAEEGRAPTSPEIAKAHPTAYLRYPRVCRLFENRAPGPNLRDGTLRAWQQELDQRLGAPPDDRTIEFYVDEDGGKGKSWFQAWYLTLHPETTQILSAGKRDDIAHSICKTKTVFFFNIPRGGMEYLQYTILEQLKDRMVYSPKYNSQMKYLTFVPHVVVFCNEQPDMTKMSLDRYRITDEYNN